MSWDAEWGSSGGITFLCAPMLVRCLSQRAADHVVAVPCPVPLPAPCPCALPRQSAGEPEAAVAAERARLRAMQDGDWDGVMAAELRIAAALLSAQFGPATVDEARGTVSLSVDGTAIVVTQRSGKVECGDGVLRGRVEKALARVTQAMRPLPLPEGAT